MERSPTLLLIRGLGHSGTTILDLALGAHPRILGMGEAARILQTPRPGEESRGPAMLRGAYRHERRCTCGETAAGCPIWGSCLEWLVLHEQRSLPEKMRHLVKLAAAHAAEASHPADVIVDSFQDDLVLPQGMDACVDVRIIHLVRDVRSWMHSRLRAARQSKRLFADWRTMARWWYVNRKFDRVLQRSGRPVFRLGYEELALQPARSLRLICDWLDLEFSERMLHPGLNTSSHILAGNRVRFDPERSRVIQYDGSWMSSPDWTVQASMLIPAIRRLNRDLVYSNQLLKG